MATTASTTTPAPPPVSVEIDPKAQYEARWWEVYNRITSSGEVTDPDERDRLTDEIIVWAYGGKNLNENGQRWMLLWPMMTGGHVKLREVLAHAKKSMARPFPEFVPPKG